MATIKEWIKNKIMGFLGLTKLNENPNDSRLTFISSNEQVNLENVRACKVWYLGDGNELLNYYTNQNISGFNKEPVYDRNRRNYFWSLSSAEVKIKRVHSGIPNAIVSTLSNVIGYPDIDVNVDGWDKIEQENDFRAKLTQQARPLTMAEGWGAWKPNFNTDLSKYPLWEFYEAEYVEYIYKCGLLYGIIFKSFYKDKHNKDYVLIETRYREKHNSHIDYDLFRLEKNDEVQTVPLDTLPELGGLENQIIEGLDKVLAVPSRYFYDPMNAKYGRSIYAGKLDLFDMLDEVWSMASQTDRVSSPITWYNPDVLDRGPNGQIGLPNLYNRQLVAKSGIPDGEGNVNQDIFVDQPDLNFDKYGALSRDILDYILTGVLSPATLGIEVAKKDNAEAQREKEKVTIMTRNNIIDAETKMFKDIVSISLMLKEFLETGKITLQEYDVSVKYCEFANPSFESLSSILSPMFTSGAISTGMYVDKLYGDSLSDKEKAEEIQKLEDMKQASDVDMNALFGEVNNNDDAVGEPMVSTEQVEEPMENTKE